MTVQKELEQHELSAETDERSDATVFDPPVEPELDPDTTPPDADALRDALLRFHLYGQRTGELQPVTGHEPLPAMFRPYRDLTRVRYDFPLCINGSESEHAFRPLSSLLDDALVELAPEGDSREKMRRYLYRVEASVKAGATSHSNNDLLSLWGKAVDTVLASDKIEENQKAEVREGLDRVRSTFGEGTRLVPCSPATAALLFEVTAAASWRRRAEALRQEIDSLIAGLQNILEADESRSKSARSASHLRGSVVDDEVDPDTMSEIIGKGAAGASMPDARRTRIIEALDTLRRTGAAFGFGNAAGEDDASPVDAKRTVTTCAEAIDEHRRRMKAMVAFFRAVRIARLEVGNRYREGVHDDFFASFDAHHLTEDEFGQYPPILLRMSPGSLTHAESGALLEMLGSGIPVKVLLEVDELSSASAAGEPSLNVLPCRIGRAAMALGEVFVMQGPVSRVDFLQSCLIDGFEFGGPGLFVVFTGKDGHHKGLDTYLVTEAAAESRLFPVFVFDPGRGDTQADRMDISANSQVENEWPTESLNYRSADGSEATAELALTPADFLACDDRFDEHFWHVDRAHWHGQMLPLSDYLERGMTGTDAGIPYIMTVDRDGYIGRVVVTRDVLGIALNVRSSWRSLQEGGGVHSSFAERLLAEEKNKLEDEKQREVETIEQNYASQLDQDIGDLTREIVHRIVGGLLSDEGLSGAPKGGSAAPREVTAKPQPAAPADAEASPAKPEAAAEEEEEEDEALTFDDPYIDTPLCTSCNECTQLNPQLFAYNDNKQAFIKDATAGPFKDLVRAAEVCPVRIIHPGKPKNPDEPGLDEWVQRASAFN